MIFNTTVEQARKLYDEVTAVIEVNRKAHRAGLEDRLQKVGALILHIHMSTE